MNKILLLILLALSTGCGSTAPTDGQASQTSLAHPSDNHPTEPVDCDKLVARKVAEMTNAQKAGQMAQVAMRYVSDINDLARYNIGSMLAGGTDFPGTDLTANAWADYADEARKAAFNSELRIPLLFAIDAVHGNGKSTNAVVLPHNIGLGATNDPELAFQAGRITALETRGSGIDWAFAPVMAAVRDERWGRTYEGFGETPQLAAKMGVAFIKGLQGEHLGDGPGVLGSAKHFAGDGATAYGTSHMGDGAVLDRGDVILDDQKLRALAVDQFQDAVNAGVGSVMISYSSVHGTKMHAHKALITDVLKGEMGFKGFVISDWMGIDDIPGPFESDIVTAINAGIDMVMIPNRYVHFINTVAASVPQKIPQARIDDAVTRILNVKCEMGLFDSDYTTATPTALINQVGSQDHRAMARKIVSASMVLLKNEHHTLPIGKRDVVHVTGTGADNLDKQCGGWTVTWQGEGNRTIGGTTVLDALKKAGPVTSDIDGTKIPQGTTKVVVVVGEDPYAEWHGDRTDLHLSKEDQSTIANVAQSGIPFVVVLFSGRPMIITDELAKADAFVAAFLPGTEGDGIADVLLGKTAPTGKLPHTWPATMDQIPINEGDDNGGGSPLFPLGFGLTYP